ncbi:MAG: ATP-NAD kinase family protein [Candidatus Thermoplasmatota archaeon]
MADKHRIGFLVNPIAGMGGKVGLKGTDGVIDEAKKRGAEPVAPKKAREMLKKFKNKHPDSEKKIQWYTCSDEMGENELKDTGIEDFEVVYTENADKTTAQDTQDACKIFLEKNVDLILFCGGDGTARDVYNVIGEKTPILGIPSGVKMHSGVFGIKASATAKILNDYVEGELATGDAEIMDLDEKRYREGEWKIKLFGTAKGIVEPTYVQVGKMSFQSVPDKEVKDEIADHAIEEMEKDKEYLYLFGPGGTVNHIAKKIDVDNSILGVDAVYKKEIVEKDVNEKQILKLLEKYPKAKVLLSPIGAQGFILGRGNLQLSPEVIKKIGVDNIMIVSTPAKLKETPVLRVDTGDKKLDEEFMEKEFMMVVIGYRLSRVVRIQTNNL